MDNGLCTFCNFWHALCLKRSSSQQPTLTTMNTTFRSILSGSAGIAIIALTSASIVAAGFDAASSLLGVGAFVLWGLLEIASLGDAPRSLVRPRPAVVKAAASANARVSIPAIVEFPALGSSRRAA